LSRPLPIPARLDHSYIYLQLVLHTYGTQ
jgi:hypothetical protein